MKTCSVTSAGDAGSSMTSRVRCAQPPLRVVWHSGQNSGAWVTCAAGSIRGRAKPWGRFLRGFFSSSAASLRLAAGLCPGILAPGPPPPDSRASRLSTRWRSSAIISSSVSRLAWFKSTSVSIVLLCHNRAPDASVFRSTRRLAYSPHQV